MSACLAIISVSYFSNAPCNSVSALFFFFRSNAVWSENALTVSATLPSVVAMLLVKAVDVFEWPSAAVANASAVCCPSWAASCSVVCFD